MVLHPDLASRGEIVIQQCEVFSDHRGIFFEAFRAGNMTAFRATGNTFGFQQSNVTISKRGTLRGMHYQTVNPQGKFVRCVSGSMVDCFIDVRSGSPTLRCGGAVLLNRPEVAVSVPPGFAHGTLALEDNTVCVYECTTVYHPESDRSICPIDLAIYDVLFKAFNHILMQPLLDFEVQISNKDLNATPLHSAELVP